MRTALLLCALLSTPLTIHSQEFEYGKPEELRGLKKVFIDTGTDTNSREKITKEIQKARLGLELLDTREGAEVLLLFNAGTDKRLMGSANPTGSASIAEVPLLTGEGMVIIPNSSGRPRLIFSFKDTQENIFEKKPAQNFVKTFIRAYKQANKSR